MPPPKNQRPSGRFFLHRDEERQSSTMSLCLQTKYSEHNTNAAQAFMPSQSLCRHQKINDLRVVFFAQRRRTTEFDYEFVFANEVQRTQYECDAGVYAEPVSVPPPKNQRPLGRFFLHRDEERQQTTQFI